MAEKLPMLALSPTMEEGTIISWKKKEGEKVEMGEVICEVETDKAAMEYESPASGVLLKILVPEGKTARVGEPIAILGEEGETLDLETEEQPKVEAQPAEVEGASKSSIEKPPEKAEKAHETTVEEQSKRLKISPLAKKLAEEHGIDVSKIKGSGPGGRIIKRDIEAAISSTTLTPPAGIIKPAIASAETSEIQEIPITQKRKIIAKRLSESKFSAPHYYLRTKVIVDELMKTRRILEEETGMKISFNAFLIKLVAEALKKHPRINASWGEDKILLYKRIDIGLAVAQEDGLITPVVRDCGSKGILKISEELKDLIERARQGRLNPEEYTGATFTISNLGMFDIEEFTAIINPPASAILAVGKIHDEPIVEDGEIHIHLVIRLTLSCDHRVIDGAVGAAFLQDLKRMIEMPLRTLL